MSRDPGVPILCHAVIIDGDEDHFYLNPAVLRPIEPGKRALVTVGRYALPLSSFVEFVKAANQAIVEHEKVHGPMVRNIQLARTLPPDPTKN